ncbi:MAG: hypothetical protein JO019_03760 [Candidatus Kaiserbacteria bacterium]|nr:hypothetical protein [Candidatus Kaiserbacteria bacterium]
MLRTARAAARHAGFRIAVSNPPKPPEVRAFNAMLDFSVEISRPFMPIAEELFQSARGLGTWSIVPGLVVMGLLFPVRTA